MKPLIGAALAAFLLPIHAARAEGDLTLKLIEAGRYDYYCTYAMEVTNTGPDGVDDINGVVELYIGDTALDRSFAASFLNVGAGETATAEFRAPHQPCDEIDGVVFVVNGCRVGRSFLKLDACVARLAPDATVKGVVSR